MSTIVPPQLQFTVNGTQFRVGSKENGRIVVKYICRVDDNDLQVLPDCGDGRLRFSIKYYALIAAGIAYDPILVLANINMDRAVVDVHEVKGLRKGNSMTVKVLSSATADLEIGFFSEASRISKCWISFTPTILV